MKRIGKEFFCFLMYIWWRLFHNLPVVSSIYFHDPSPAMFERVLKWYKKHKYRIISVQELKSIIEEGCVPNERLAFISLDDGWRSNLDLLPICEKYNAPITVFVTTEPLASGNYWWEYVTKAYGRKKMFAFKQKSESAFYGELNDIKKHVLLERSSMTENELTEFGKSKFVTIMPHTVSHPILTNLCEESLNFEIENSKKYLEQLLGYNMDVFSYPNGDMNEKVVACIKKHGFKYAFTVKPQAFDLKTITPFELPRRALNTYGGKYENLTKLIGVWYKLFPID